MMSSGILIDIRITFDIRETMIRYGIVRYSHQYSNCLRHKKRKYTKLLPGILVYGDLRYNHILFNIIDQLIKDEERKLTLENFGLHSKLGHGQIKLSIVKK
jgi:hypothetical protein